MFQRDYLNMPKKYEGKLRIRHVKDIVRNEIVHNLVVKQRLADGVREDHTAHSYKKFVLGAVHVNDVPNLFSGRNFDEITHLNNLVKQCGRKALEDAVVRLCVTLKKCSEEHVDFVFGGPHETARLEIASVRGVIFDALTAEMHAVSLQQDTDRRAFAVVLGADQKAGAWPHQAAKVGGRKRAGTGLLSASRYMLALVTSFLAREKVTSQREWHSSHEHSQYSPCGNFILTHSNKKKRLKLCHTTSGRVKFTLSGHNNFVTSCCFFPDGKAILSASSDGFLKVWNTKTAREPTDLNPNLDMGMNSCVDVSHDSTRILSVDYDTAMLLNAITGEIQHTVEFDMAHATCCSFSPNSTAFLVGLEPADLQAVVGFDLMLYNTTSYELQRTFKGHISKISTCSFAPDGATVLSGSHDSTMKLWCVATGQILHTLEGHTHEVSSCAFSPSGMAIVSSSKDCTLRLWMPSMGQQQIIDVNPDHKSCSASFSPDGKSVLGSYLGGTIKTWRYQEKVGVIPGALVSIFCSNVSVAVQEALRRLARETPGFAVEFLTNPAEIAERGTHLITGTELCTKPQHQGLHLVKRTDETVKAFVNGLWILDAKWITDSLLKGKLQPEENYAVLMCSKPK
jgi:hypothetical protein